MSNIFACFDDKGIDLSIINDVGSNMKKPTVISTNRHVLLASNDNNITNYDFKYTNEFIDLLDIKNEFIVLENNECFLVKCKNCIQTSNSANILLINKNIILNNKIIDDTKLIESKKMIKEFEHFKKKN